MRLLIVGDEPSLAQGLLPLVREGHWLLFRALGADLLERVLSERIDLIILDTDPISSFEHVLDLCSTIQLESATRLLLVGGSRRSVERTRALEAGADDWVRKPIDADELLARVHALLRRSPSGQANLPPRLVQVTEEVWLDRNGQQLVREGKTLPLSRREFQLLTYLLRHEGTVLSREALLNGVWGPGYEGSEREVDVYVRYLRQKVKLNASEPRSILTVWGKGYVYKGLRLAGTQSDQTGYQ
ncbi:MAG: response regulator transcription factor [Chloroflexi bacterium]|nr:response regulator transcription factor [Chloroflexota bacterium]